MFFIVIFLFFYHFFDLFYIQFHPSLFYFIWFLYHFFVIFFVIFLKKFGWLRILLRDFFGLTFYRVTRSHDMGHEFQILARFDFDLFLGSFFFQFHESILYHQAFNFVSFVDFLFLGVIPISYLKLWLVELTQDFFYIFLSFAFNYFVCLGVDLH